MDSRLRRHLTPGFTLMELLIVVIIVGILSTLALPQFPRAMERARQAEARSMLGSLWQAERLYYSENPSTGYVSAPGTSNPLMTDFPASGSNEHYFTYTVVAASPTAYTATATRKTTGGRNPPYSTAYTVTIDESGTYTVTGF